MIYILGLDGLEYNFVEEWNLANLKQREFGKIEVPINEVLQAPTSPEIWASFLTGKYIQMSFESTSFLQENLFKLLKFMRRYVNVSLRLGRKVKRMDDLYKNLAVMTLGEYLGEKTFLDLTNSKKINAPYHNYDGEAFDIVRDFGQKKFSMIETIARLMFLYEKRKRQILDETEKGIADVTFAYMHFPDTLQHLTYLRPDKIKRHYLDLNSYVSILKTKIKKPTTFVIVSDHGFDLKKGSHTHHGFYSSNVALDPKPEKITDFYKIIIRG